MLLRIFMVQFVLPVTLEGATTARKLLKVDVDRNNQLHGNKLCIANNTDTALKEAAM